MPIPADISRQDLLKAIAEFDEGTEHPFGDSTKYDLIYKKKRYPPKAIVGLAARRVLRRPLRPDDFSGGEDAAQANGLLRKHGFQVDEKKGATAATPGSGDLSAVSTTWVLEPGDRIRRLDLHAAFGGQGQGGISTPGKTNHVFVFTDPKAGRQHGYIDGWEGDGVKPKVS